MLCKSGNSIEDIEIITEVTLNDRRKWENTKLAFNNLAVKFKK